MGISATGVITGTIMAKASSKKLCSICGHSLPLFSKATGRLCAVCRRCSTCGSRKLNSVGNQDVKCLDCGNTWDSVKTLERELISCNKSKCIICHEVIPYLVLQTHACLCEDHFKCPDCGNDDLVMTFPNRKLEMMVAYQCEDCSWTGSPRQLERELQKTNPLK